MTGTMNPLLSRLWPGRLVVTFHGIGTPARTLDAGEAPYWVEAPVLAAAIDLAAKGRLEITFDDGNESDARIALPMLQRAGVTATFFVLAGRLDKPGSLSRTQLQELARAGMAIGSHGHDHVDWTRADDTDLRRELWDSRAAIEDCLGAPVDSVSVPFGAFDARVCGWWRRPAIATSIPVPEHLPRGRTGWCRATRSDRTRAWRRPSKPGHPGGHAWSRRCATSCGAISTASVHRRQVPAGELAQLAEIHPATLLQIERAAGA